jgi:asparagine synthase (glutamine-hydrolysing)
LSIIDLATGDQPMQSCDGRYVIVFNGEIYNFSEMREILLRGGAVFRTRSDTEVILEGYRRWGPDVVMRLNGMFAFAIWDREKQLVFGARDRMGIKPLCWTLHRGAFIVCSTLEPFSTMREFNHIDPIAVRDLMAFDYVSAPRTIFASVKKIEPGNRFEWRLGDAELTIDRYWSPPRETDGHVAPDEFELEDLLERAVHRQMVSDVPIGAFLSGGIDSSLLVALMARHSYKPVRTFSVGFSGSDFDESSIAEIVACQFGTDHSRLNMEELDSNSLVELMGDLDEPFCDATLVPTFVLSKMTKRHVKVALSGDGGDEVFGGYPKYIRDGNGSVGLPDSSLFHRVLTRLPWRPRGMAHIYERTLSPEERFHFSLCHYGDFPVFRKDLRQLISRRYHELMEIGDYFEPWQRRSLRYGETIDTDVLMRTDLETYLTDNCLVKTDRASMLASLEVRVPYLDEIVVNRIFPLPSSDKIVNGQLKALLLPIARRLLPREVWDRPKHGFNVPLDVRLAGAWRPAVEAVLDWGESNFDLFDYGYIRRLHKINVTEGGISGELWNPFVLLAWAMTRSVRL